MKASVKNYRQSPRKVRLVADLVRGKKVADALVQLQFLPKRASLPVSKLLSSAMANAKTNFKMAPEALFIQEITVNQGVTIKRMMPRSRGMANPINKRTSNIAVTLGTQGPKKGKKKVVISEEVAEKPVKAVKKKTAVKKVAKTTSAQASASSKKVAKKPVKKKS